MTYHSKALSIIKPSLSIERPSFSDYFQMFVAVAFEDDLYIGKIKKVYKEKVTVFYFKKMQEDNEPSSVTVFTREPNDGEKEVSETVFVVDVDFQIVLKNTPDFRSEIPSLPKIVKNYLIVLRLNLSFLNHLQTSEKAGIISSFNSCDVQKAYWTKAGRSFI